MNGSAFKQSEFPATVSAGDSKYFSFKDLEEALKSFSVEQLFPNEEERGRLLQPEE